MKNISNNKDKETLVYQAKVVESLEYIFGDENVENEWDVAKESMDGYNRELYCPIIDVAIGPFNTDGNVDENNRRINLAIEEYGWFIDRLVKNSETEIGSSNDFLEYKNQNPRCLLTIEIEKTGSRKHLLGDIANASIIGAVGIVVPLNQDMLNGFKALKKYIKFATSVKKLPPSFNNVLVINWDNFLRVINTDVPNNSHSNHKNRGRF